MTAARNLRFSHWILSFSAAPPSGLVWWALVWQKTRGDEDLGCGLLPLRNQAQVRASRPWALSLTYENSQTEAVLVNCWYNTTHLLKAILTWLRAQNQTIYHTFIHLKGNFRIDCQDWLVAHTSKYAHVRERTANISWISPPINHLRFTRWNVEFQQGNRDCKWKLLWIISATFQGSCFSVPQVESWQWQMAKQLASLKLFSLVLDFPPQCSPWILPWRIPTPLARRSANGGRQHCDKLMLFLDNSDLIEVMQNIKLRGALGGR